MEKYSLSKQECDHRECHVSKSLNKNDGPENPAHEQGRKDETGIPK
jgi:hypothetical protein